MKMKSSSWRKHSSLVLRECLFALCGNGISWEREVVTGVRSQNLYSHPRKTLTGKVGSCLSKSPAWGYAVDYRVGVMHGLAMELAIRVRMWSFSCRDS